MVDNHSDQSIYAAEIASPETVEFFHHSIQYRVPGAILQLAQSVVGSL